MSSEVYYGVDLRESHTRGESIRMASSSASYYGDGKAKSSAAKVSRTACIALHNNERFQHERQACVTSHRTLICISPD